MKLKQKLIISLLGSAMLALPVSVPAFAEPAYTTNSRYIQPVEWWDHHHHHDWDDYGYRHRPYYRGYGYGYSRRWGGYGACGRARELEDQAWQDRWRGHPAAAGDVAQMAAEARARCYNRY